MKKSIAGLAAGSLLVGAIAIGATTGLAPAATAGGVSCSPATESALFPMDSKARTKVSAAHVSRVGNAYVATVRLTAVAGSATAEVTKTICPDGSGGYPSSATQSAWDVPGVATKTVTRRAGSAKKAAKAARTAAVRAKAAFTRSTTRRSADLASSAALARAVTLVNRDLVTSRVVYLVRRGTKLTLESRSIDGASTLKVLPNGDLALTVKQWNAKVDPGATPCITKAPSWNNAFLGGGGTVTWSGATPTGVTAPAVAVQNIAFWSGISLADFSENISASWTYRTDSSAGVANQKATPSSLLCFKPTGAGTDPAGTLVIHGFRIGTAQNALAQVLGARVPAILNAG